MRSLIALLVFILSGLNCHADSVELHGKPPETMGKEHRAPMRPWFIDLTDCVITMPATPCDYTLALYDADGDVAYTVFVPAGTTQVALPATLSGDFELRFETDGYYYFGFVNL